MPIQTSYSETSAALQAGLIVNQETKHNVISRVLESAAGIGFGKVVVRGSGVNGCAVPAVSGTAVGAAVAGNTGNGTITASPTVGAGARVGIYRLICVEPGTNVGTFEMEDPDGNILGRAVVAVEAVLGGLTFTIADGATDFVVGDMFTITVSGAPDFLGITVRNPAVDNETTPDTYAQYDVVSIMTEGVIAVAASVAVSHGEPAYFVPSTGVITNVASGNIPMNAIFDANAAENALVPLRLKG